MIALHTTFIIVLDSSVREVKLLQGSYDVRLDYLTPTGMSQIYTCSNNFVASPPPSFNVVAFIAIIAFRR